MVTEKLTCRLCGNGPLEQVLDLGSQPPANAFLKLSDIENERSYPLLLSRCTDDSCGFLQLGHVVDPETLFADYVYVSSTSPSFVRHFEEYARSLHEILNLHGKRTLDIGSNDGVLLKPLKALGADVLGVDPARAIAQDATQRGLPTMNGYFGETLAKTLLEEKGKMSLITANNVFAHIDDLHDVMRGVELLLDDDGLFVIEAPYLVDFLEKRLFDTIYHEHLSYLSLRPLSRFFATFGMRIVRAPRTDTHGGSIRIHVARIGSVHAESDEVAAAIAGEVAHGLYEKKTYEEFARAVSDNKTALTSLLASLKKEGKRIAGYGAPAKGNTLLNYMGIGTDILEYIVDDSPLKQGLLTPGMHIPVVSSAELAASPPDYLFLLAWNFAGPIMEKNASFKAKGGRFIIPVPSPMVV